MDTPDGAQTPRQCDADDLLLALAVRVLLARRAERAGSGARTANGAKVDVGERR